MRDSDWFFMLKLLVVGLSIIALYLYVVYRLIT